MAWLFADGFDSYNNFLLDAVNTDDQWYSMVACFNSGSTGKYGRGTGLYLGNNSATAGTAITQAFANSSTIYVNLVMNMNKTITGGGGVSARQGFRLIETAGNQMGFWLRDNGTFEVTNGLVSGTVLAASSQLIPNGVNSGWFHMQVKVVIHNTLGSVELRLNGATSASWNPTGLNTRNGTVNAYCNQLALQGSTQSNHYMDDFLVFNDQGDAPNTWVGEVCAIQQLPNADVQAQWTRNGGATNVSRINQATNDQSTTYNGSSTPGDEDLFSMTALPFTPANIIGVQTKMVRALSGSGVHKVKQKIISGSATSEDVERTAWQTWVWTKLLSTTDPDTGLPWTPAAINASQVGYERV